MDRIYENASDVHVRATYVYVKSGDNYAYSDPDCTKTITSDELYDLYVKGLIIDDGVTIYHPVSYSYDQHSPVLVYAVPAGDHFTLGILYPVA